MQSINAVILIDKALFNIQHGILVSWLACLN